MKPIRRELQLIFQDPYGSLDPRQSIGSILKEAIVTANPKPYTKEELQHRIAELLEIVELLPEMVTRYPHELSLSLIHILNYYKENGILASSYYANFEKAEATDANTIVCHFTEWDALFDYSLCRTTLIASKKAFDEKGKDDLAANPVGTGPFTLKSYTTDVEMVLSKNPNYWQGTVHLDELKMVKYSQEVVAATAVQTGEIQGMVTEAYNIVSQIVNSGVDLQSYSSKPVSYTHLDVYKRQP